MAKREEMERFPNKEWQTFSATVDPVLAVNLHYYWSFLPNRQRHDMTSIRWTPTRLFPGLEQLVISQAIVVSLVFCGKERILKPPFSLAIIHSSLLHQTRLLAQQ